MLGMTALGIRNEPGEPVRWTDALRLWSPVAAGVFLLAWLGFDAATGLGSTPMATVLVLILFSRLGEPAEFRPPYARTAMFGSVAIGAAVQVAVNAATGADRHMWPRAWTEFGTTVLTAVLFVAGTHLPRRSRTSGSAAAAGDAAA